MIVRNVAALAEVRARRFAQRRTKDRIADAITKFVGSMAFVYLHVAWFGAWITANVGWLGVRPFDPFPFGLLTMIVSLEAIFLSTFVLISQNRMMADGEESADLDLQVDLLAEQEVTRMARLLDRVAQRMGIDTEADSEIREVERDVRPEELLKRIREQNGES